MLDPLPLTIPHLVEAAATARGDAPALIEEGATWSFTQLRDACRATASAMLVAGIGSGDRVAIWAPNRREWIAGAVGAMTCGAAIVPLNTRLKGGEAGELLRRTRAAMLLTVGDFLGTDYPAMLTHEDLPDLRRIVTFDRDWDGFLAEGNGSNDPAIDTAMAGVTPDSVSDILFTSGTTGAPKGVVSTHDRVVRLFAAWAETMGLEEGERYLIINPFFHSFGYKAGWVAALIAGATILPVASFDVALVARMIAQERINFLPGPPTIYYALLEAKAQQDFDTGSLRGAATGAATVPPDLIRRMRSELGLVDTVTAYGMTECGTITSCRRGDDADLIAESCGKAIPGLEVRVADDDGLSLPPGEAGEILVRGYGVMREYLDDPDATAEAIDSDGWLHTGDIGTLDDAGYLRITDRKKDMFISGGFNVYPAEVERLLAACPAIAQVAVIGVADARMGEVGKAFIVRRTASSADEGEIIAWARANIANYKVPRSVEFVDSLPQNASGKVMKNLLAGR